jgi:hypothetical protein
MLAVSKLGVNVNRLGYFCPFCLGASIIGRTAHLLGGGINPQRPLELRS